MLGGARCIGSWLSSAFHLEQMSYRSWQRTYGKSVQVCAPGMFVERVSRLAVSNL